MCSILEVAPAKTREMLESLIEAHYPELLQEKVVIDLLVARAELTEAGEPKAPAIVHGGISCDGMCRVIGYKDRVKGMGDAEITVSGDWWDVEGRTDAERLALLDHELYHIVLADDKDGGVKTDDLGRPKIRMRKHDRQYGWFDEIAERHGGASHEVQQAKSLLEGETGKVYQLTQAHLDLVDEPPKRPDTSRRKKAASSST